ncbi:MAG: hypothetical protein HOO93_08615 [Methyloglobulus sp.]|nr:hypothetical protein [Methyloglobulus sp.]
MIAILINAVAMLFVLVLLVVFVQGAWRHTVEQTLGDPILADPSSHAKTKRYFTLLGKVLWNIAVPVVMVGAVLVEFMGLMAETKNDELVNTGDDFRYKHEGERYYTHSTPGDSKAFWY